MKLAEKIYAELAASGVEVILDDRDERPGVKFKDPNWSGFPIRLGHRRKIPGQRRGGIKAARRPMILVKVEDAVPKILELLAKPAA